MSDILPSKDKLLIHVGLSQEPESRGLVATQERGSLTSVLGYMVTPQPTDPTNPRVTDKWAPMCDF